MKKILIFSAILFLFLNDAFATFPVLSRRVTNIGFFGAKFTTTTPSLFTFGATSLIGYAVTCSEPGISRCPRMGEQFRNLDAEQAENAEWDEVQIVKIDDLVTFALEQIAAGDLEGSNYINVQVAGETTIRRYEVTWSSDDTDALTSEITITRDDF